MTIQQGRLDEVASFPWLQRCGEALPSLPFLTKQVSSWAEAEVWFAGDEWEAKTGDAQGEITVRLQKVAPQAAACWNSEVKMIRGWVEREIEPKISLVVEHHQLSPLAIECIKWDVLHALMEEMFARHHLPSFFRNLLVVYETGHMPVGWDESVQPPRIVVY